MLVAGPLEHDRAYLPPKYTVIVLTLTVSFHLAGWRLKNALHVQATDYCLLLQLYKKRGKFLETDEERQLWASITPEFMSDEDDSEDGTSFVVRTVVWRHLTLESLIHRLTQRRRSLTKRVIGEASHRLRSDSCPPDLVLPEMRP